MVEGAVKVLMAQRQEEGPEAEEVVEQMEEAELPVVWKQRW